MLTVSSAGAAAYAADRLRVAYVGTEVVGPDGLVRRSKMIDDEVVREIGATHIDHLPIDVVDLRDTAGSPLCTDRDCVQGLARTANATFLVRARAQTRSDASHECCKVKIEVLRADDFAVVFSDMFDCHDECRATACPYWLSYWISSVMTKLPDLSRDPTPAGPGTAPAGAVRAHVPWPAERTALVELERARDAMAHQDFPSAAALARAALADARSDDVESRLLFAQALFMLGHEREAERQYQRVLVSAPDDRTAIERLEAIQNPSRRGE